LKLEVCKSIGAYLLIEDAPENAVAVSDGGIPVLLPERPWNAALKHPGVTPVDSWEKAVRWITKNV